MLSLHEPHMFDAFLKFRTSLISPLSTHRFRRGFDIVLVEIDGNEYFMTSNGYIVQMWKFWAALYVGAGGVGSSFLIIAAHFDTFCLPRTWMHIFRDGSRGELYVIAVLFLFWAGGLHVCTSSLSVGEVQPNVYFTSWIGTLFVLVSRAESIIFMFGLIHLTFFSLTVQPLDQ